MIKKTPDAVNIRALQNKDEGMDKEMGIVSDLKETLYQKALRQARLEIANEYSRHRTKLFEASAKLRDIRDELSEKEDRIENAEKALTAKEKELTKAVTEKMKADLSDILDQKRAAEEELHRLERAVSEYRDALYRTEERLFDWSKRLEKKELDVFAEMQTDVDKLKKYGENASKRGFEFERLFADILKNNGFYDVEVTKASGDYGGDILAQKDDLCYVVQCKSYSSAVGIEAVQQAFAAKAHYGAHVAVVATDSIFTKEAKVFAEEAKVVLWDCERIAKMAADSETK